VQSLTPDNCKVTGESAPSSAVFILHNQRLCGTNDF
jgi:hypothetical protein